MILNVLKQNQLSQTIDLGKEVLSDIHEESIFLIGRSKECHVAIDDKKISRQHSKVIHRAGGWFIEAVAQDGLPIIINGSEVVSSKLVNNSMFSIGPYQFIVHVNKNLEQLKSNVEQVSLKQFDSYSINQIIEPSKEEVTSEILVSEPTKEHVFEESEYAESPDDFIINELRDDSPELQLSESTRIEQRATEPNINQENDEQSFQGEEQYSLASIDESEREEKTQVLQNFSTAFLELFGEFIPYDKFILENQKVLIGRDASKCQIVLNDPEVSSVHASISRNFLEIVLEDLKSGNGTILNGHKINKSTLQHNDEFIIGSTTFTLKIRSQFIKEEQQTLLPVEENQEVEVEEVVEIEAEEGEQVNALGEIETPVQDKSLFNRIWKNDENRKKLIYGVVVIVGAWFMLDEEQPAAPAKKNPTEVTKSKNELENSKSSNSKLNEKSKAVVALSDDERRKFSELFNIGKQHFSEGRYAEALEALDQIYQRAPDFERTLGDMIETSKKGLAKLEEIERRRQLEIQAQERKSKIKEFLEKAKKYTEERNLEAAEDWFLKIIEIDPENIEVSRMRRELELWDKENKRKEQEELSKKKDRELKVEKLKPGKNYYLQREWYKAIIKLDEFLKLQGMDEDLLKEAAEMLKSSRDELNAAVTPLDGKAKSLQEGQDLKSAYEVYQQILKFEPSHPEALNQVNTIKELLTIKARKIYREAIISESLSLFIDAKEKFQEVQQISPSDSEYFKRASEKLKEYLD